jgi:pimeloyl-ACP methyl ester carboxylesterase/DNA-binding CsgD family transcriptional regulator
LSHPASFLERLKAQLLAGRHMDLLHEEWSSVDEGLRDDASAMTTVLEAAARLDLAIGAAAMAPDGGYAVAVYGPGGRRCYADALFDAWWPEGEEPIAKAASAGVTVLRGAGGAVICCWVGDAASSDRWTVPPAARAALDAGQSRVLAVLFAPTQSVHLGARISAAFDLSRVEAELVNAVMFFPTLDAAAADVGLGRETAKDILRRVMAKVGVKRSSELVRKVADLMCGVVAAGPDDEALLVRAFALTPAEARVAARMGGGLTAPQAALELGVEAETARGHSKTALAKLGVPRTKDLSRLVSEIGALSNMAGAAEIVIQPAELNLRMIPAGGGPRRIALLDYGPRGADPILVSHGGVIRRALPAAFVQALQARGLRPIVPQRPGFGLTDPAQGDYLATAADDLDVLCERLDLGLVAIVGREGGSAAALEFAARHPGRVHRGVLLNPLTPLGFEQTAPGILTRITRTVMRHPRLAITFIELFRRQSRSSLAENNLRRSLERIEVDRLCLQNPEVVASLVRDAQALTAHSSAGLAAEMEVFGRGWSAPALTGPAPWRILHLGGLACEPVFAPWADLPGAELFTLDAAARLAEFTHPEQLADLLA